MGGAAPANTRPRITTTDDQKTMGLLYLFSRQGSLVLLVLLLAAVGLTFWECRERRYSVKATLWWTLFVFTLAHVVGYIILRFLVRSPRKAGA